MADNTEKISIDEQVANTLASQLANENLQLRQVQIRTTFELEEARAEIEELKATASTGDAAKKDSSKK